MGETEPEGLALPRPATACASSPLIFPQHIKQLEYEDAKSMHDPQVARQELMDRGDVSDGYQMYFTSGTTGFPKGVVLSHAIVVKHALGTMQGTFLMHQDLGWQFCAGR